MRALKTFGKTRIRLDQVPDYREPAVSCLAEQNELKIAVERAISRLPRSFRPALRLRFGLHDDYSYTLEEAGRILRCSRERVRAMESIGLSRLENPIRAKHLAKFLTWIPTRNFE